MKLKRRLAFLLAFLMAISVLSILVGCGQKTETKPQDTAAPSITDQITEGPEQQQEDTPKYGGTFYYSPGSDGPSTFGTPWNPNVGFAAVTEPFAGYLTAQWPDGSVRLVLSKGYNMGFDEESGLYWVEHELYDNIYLHPHELDEAEHVDADMVVWNAYMMKEKSYWAPSLVKVEATDKYKVRAWHAYTTNSAPLVLGCGWMCSRKLYEAFGEEYMDEHVISSGPFRVVENVPGSHVTYERFDNYFETGKPYYDRVVIVYLNEVQMQNIALESDGEGRLDCVATNTAEQAGYFKQKGYTILSLPNQTICFVMSNQLPEDHPLMDIRVRQAISMAIDRETLTQALGYGVHTPAYQHIPPGFAGYNPDPNYGVPRYDPERAKQLLAEAGYPNGFTITLIPPTSVLTINENQAVAIANYLEEIGIKCELKIYDGTELAQVQRETGWGDALFIGCYISWFTAEDSANANFRHTEGAMPSFKDLVPDEEFTSLIEATQKVGDNSAEAAALRDYVLENLHVIPLWYQGRYHIVHPRVGGYREKDHMLFFENLYQRY